MNKELEQAARRVAEKLLGWRLIQDERIQPRWENDQGERRSLDYLLTGDGMAEVMAALVKNPLGCGFSHSVSVGYTICQLPFESSTDDTWLAEIDCEEHGRIEATADTTPEALLLAAAKVIDDGR